MHRKITFDSTKVLLFAGSRECTRADYNEVMRATALAIEELTDKNLIGKGKQKIICRHGDCPASWKEPEKIGGDQLFAEAVSVMSTSMESRGIYLVLDPHPARWRQYGTAAGPIRNKFMIDLEPKPDLGIFVVKKGAGNKGTLGCMKLAKDAGITVLPPYAV